MRTCQHRQGRQRRQPPPTLTKHSAPKVAGNSPLPISYDEIISLKFRHFQHMIEHSIIELHAKLQGAHRTTAPHPATSSTRASPPPATGSPGTLTWSCHNTPECIKQPRPRPWMKRGRGRGRVGGMLPGRNGRSVEAADPAREGQAPSGGGDCESDEAEEPEGGVHRGKVAGLVNKREDQPGDRTGDAG